jgi:hypothetical protein
MAKSQKNPEKSSGFGLFKLPEGYEEMTIDEQQQALTNIMREVGKVITKVK